PFNEMLNVANTTGSFGDIDCNNCGLVSMDSTSVSISVISCQTLLNEKANKSRISSKTANSISVNSSLFVSSIYVPVSSYPNNISTICMEIEGFTSII